MLRYGVFNNFNDAGTLILSSKSDNFFIAAIIDPLSVGIYAFYTRLSEMAQQLLPGRLFENVVQPLFFAVPAGEADRKLPRYFSLLVNLNLLMQWPVLAFVTAYHAEIVQVVFGGKFIEHSWLLPVIVGFATFNIIAVPVTLVAQYEEKVQVILWSKVFGNLQCHCDPGAVAGGGCVRSGDREWNCAGDEERVHLVACAKSGQMDERRCGGVIGLRALGWGGCRMLLAEGGLKWISYSAPLFWVAGSWSGWAAACTWTGNLVRRPYPSCVIASW